MSTTPIFEQLCRDFSEAGKTRPVHGVQLPIARPPKAPAHALEDTVSGLVPVRGHQPSVLPDWVCPAG